jgi:hypothetical protein
MKNCGEMLFFSGESTPLTQSPLLFFQSDVGEILAKSSLVSATKTYLRVPLPTTRSTRYATARSAPVGGEVGAPTSVAPSEQEQRASLREHAKEECTSRKKREKGMGAPGPRKSLLAVGLVALSLGGARPSPPTPVHLHHAKRSITRPYHASLLPCLYSFSTPPPQKPLDQQQPACKGNQNAAAACLLRACSLLLATETTGCCGKRGEGELRGLIPEWAWLGQPA